MQKQSRTVLALTLAAALALGTGGTALAHGGHGSCAGFGNLAATTAQANGGLGTLVAPQAVAGLAAEALAAEHAAFCA